MGMTGAVVVKKIILDGTCIKSNSTGIGNYAISLAIALQKYAKEAEFHVLLRRNYDNKNVLPSNINIIRGICDKSKYLPWDFEGFNGNYDLLHEPNFIPRKFSGPTIVTIADLSCFLYPQFQPFRRVQMAQFFKNRMLEADHILTISENSKHEIIEHFKVPEEKVTVTYLGCSLRNDDRRAAKSEEQLFLAGIKIKSPFILSVCTLEPRKNLLCLLDAFSVLCQQGISRDLKLVLAGGKGWMYNEIFARFKERQIDDRVIVTGYVSDAELSILYRNALAFVYPSLYEGFGLPPLEAMSYGTPVITSNTSSLPEVVGDAGIMFDPASSEELCEAMRQVIEKDAVRLEMQKKGLEWAQKFTWEKCADETMNVYRELLY